jgi:hypothetical protein
MKITKKRCEFCHEWFPPDPRTVKSQRSCAKPDCRKQRRNDAVKNWRRQNPDGNKGRGPKIKVWAKAYPGYWRQYRRRHPEYAARDNQRRRSARQIAKSAAKRNEIARISLEKLESIRAIEPISAAKRNEIHRRVEGILDYLFWKESAAKQDAIATYTPVERQYEYATANLGGDKTIEPG